MPHKPNLKDAVTGVPGVPYCCCSEIRSEGYSPGYRCSSHQPEPLCAGTNPDTLPLPHDFQCIYHSILRWNCQGGLRENAPSSDISVETGCAVSIGFASGHIPLKTFRRNVSKIKAQQAGHRAERSCSLRPRKAVFLFLFRANESDTARRVPTSLHLASCAQLDQPFRGQFFKIFSLLHDGFCYLLLRFCRDTACRVRQVRIFQPSNKNARPISQTCT